MWGDLQQVSFACALWNAFVRWEIRWLMAWVYTLQGFIIEHSDCRCVGVSSAHAVAAYGGKRPS